jgi:hypothetical protein
MLLVPIPWAGRVWALPFLSILAPSERYTAQRGKQHKKITHWARRALLLVRRWWPEREIVAVADSGYASLRLLASCRRFLPKPVTFVTRLRLDAALYEPAPPRRAGQMGRPRLKGERLPNLAVVAEDPSTLWAPAMVDNWYGSGERTVEVASATAVWYSTGLPAVPIRWVLVRDPQGEFATQALLCTDLDARAEQILRWFVLRWQMETTFQETRRHLGVETQRQWSDLAIRRTLPRRCWASSRSLPYWPTSEWHGACRPFGGQHGIVNLVRPSPMLWRWYARSYGCTRLFVGRYKSRTR